MFKKRIVLGIFLVFLSTMIAAPPDIFGSEETGTPGQDKFSQEELDQMLAPIALYPDELLSQMLMAATYPLEIIESNRWVAKNPGLKGDQLDKALQDKDWDVSVKSLTHFPEVLAMMDEKIEWTTLVGDAFLAQQNEVMDTIQDLRARADAEGNLTTTRERNVVEDGENFLIEPGYSGLLYVPVYDPFWVYGAWWYPLHPPYVCHYPGMGIRSGFFRFAYGYPAGFGFGWCDWDWRRRDIRIDYYRTNHFHKVEHHRSHGWQWWEHDPGHRRGVVYWNRNTSHRFGQSSERPAQGRHDARDQNEPGVREHTEVSGPVSGQEVQEHTDVGGTVSRQGVPQGHTQVGGSVSGQGAHQGHTEVGGSVSNQGAHQGHTQVGGSVSNQGVHQGHTQVGGSVSRHRVHTQPPSVFTGPRNGTSEQRASDRGQFSRGISGGGSQSSGVTSGGGRGGSGGSGYQGTGGSAHGGGRISTH